MKISWLLRAFLLASTSAAPANRSHAIKESHIIPSSFTRVGDPPGDHRLRLTVGLKQDRFGELESRLFEVSDPDHPRYGQHLSQQDVEEFVRPSNESLTLVREWLHEYVEPQDIEYTTAQDFLSFTLPLADVERLIHTKYSIYRHDDGSEIVRTSEWSLPPHLHDHITVVQPTTAFIQVPNVVKLSKNDAKSERSVGRDLRPDRKKSTVAKTCNQNSVTPDCLRTLYGVIDYVPKAGESNRMAINNWLGQISNRSDARIFLERFRPGAIAGGDEFEEVSVNGGPIQQSPVSAEQREDYIGMEGNLDVQTALGISWPIQTTVYSTGSEGQFKRGPLEAHSATYSMEPYLTWLNYLLQQPSIPQVISSSYAADERSVPPAYAKAVCRLFAQLGARGVSVFFASGDSGVSGSRSLKTCGSKTDFDPKQEFLPEFPASCPYVTAVGATVNFEPEQVASCPNKGWAPGAGFSNYFAQPSWQSDDVAAYLDFYEAIHPEYSNLYNRSGRAYPDLAANGVNHTTIYDGEIMPLSGTSASTPTVAAIFSLVNDALISRGKPPLGWINPWLYKQGRAAFVDVMTGSAIGCNTPGFEATTGWDLASGFGTPRFDKLLEAVGL